MASDKDPDDRPDDASVAGVHCGTCGHGNPAGANFCSNCGAALAAGRRDAADTADHDTTAMLAVGDLADGDDALSTAAGEGLPVLAVVQGPNAGTRLSVMSDVVTIGRHPDSDLFLDDITVSRRHAEVRRTGDRHVVVDVGSLNGIYLNDEQVDQADLAVGDEVRVGRYLIRFVHG